MLRYFGRRILVFIPTLLVISMVAFALSRVAPGDPVECGFEGASEMNLGSASDQKMFEKIYREEAKAKGLDKPYFYFSFTAAAYPDTLYRILDRFERRALGKLIAQYGNWPQIEHYFSKVKELEKNLFALPKDQSRNAQIALLRNLQELEVAFAKDHVSSLLHQMTTTINGDSLVAVALQSPLQELTAAHQDMVTQTTLTLLNIPTVHFYGLNNQYHHWLSNFFRGNFGKSCRNGQPVFERIKTGLFWTLMISIPTIFLAFLIAIPIGVYAGVKQGSWYDRVSAIVVFMLYSLPSFWIATMLIVFFTTKEYGRFMDIFPSIGLGNLPSSAPFWDRFWETTTHLILPVLCMTYAALAFISRQMRTSVLNVIRQDYIRTARAKGLPENRIVWKHLFRNALFPLITMIALVLPGIIAGSVVIELIFNIPGMGLETVNAIRARDWPVVYAILMLAALLTLIGNLLGDLLYAWADPRITYETQ